MGCWEAKQVNIFHPYHISAPFPGLSETGFAVMVQADLFEFFGAFWNVVGTGSIFPNIQNIWFAARKLMRIKIARLVFYQKKISVLIVRKDIMQKKMSPCEAQNKATFGNVLIINLVIIIKMTARGP